MKINQRYELDIFLDEINIFDSPGVVLVKGEIFEAIPNPIPTCSLDLMVPTGWVNNRAIADGTKIRFDLTFLEFDFPYKESYNFRLFNVKRLKTEQKFVHILIEGLLDFYKGYEEGNQYNGYGRSSRIINTIANANNITADIDITEDEQLWVAGENNVYQFINYMTERSWINDTSTLFWCFDRQKRLLYKDLTNLFLTHQRSIFKFVQSPDAYVVKNQFSYTKASAAIQSGTNNLVNGGYGGDDYYFDLLDYKLKSVSAKKVVAESRMININKELSRGLGNSWFPFNIGNVHENSALAKKQNIRGLSTFSSYVRIESQFFQPYRLAQVVNFEYLDSQNPDCELKCLSGLYMINAIHISLSTVDVTASLELVMQGLNSQTLTFEVF